ncbi:SprT-like domain-containing protein [Planctomycetota bacterium]
MNMTSEKINTALKSYQIQADDWNHQPLVENLHIWSERFHSGFKLKTNLPVLTLDKLRNTCYGHFRPGRNGFGLRNEIAINENYINAKNYWQALGTLLHELLHAEQEQIGKPGKSNYHNKEFRSRAESLGLIVDQWGHTSYTPAPSPFWDLLEKYGIEVPDLKEPESVIVSKPGNSKLKLWFCSCDSPVRIRVAISDFQARCLKCGQLFVRKS